MKHSNRLKLNLIKKIIFKATFLLILLQADLSAGKFSYDLKNTITSIVISGALNLKVFVTDGKENLHASIFFECDCYEQIPDIKVSNNDTMLLINGKTKDITIKFFSANPPNFIKLNDNSDCVFNIRKFSGLWSGNDLEINIMNGSNFNLIFNDVGYKPQKISIKSGTHSKIAMCGFIICNELTLFTENNSQAYIHGITCNELIVSTENNSQAYISGKIGHNSLSLEKNSFIRMESVGFLCGDPACTINKIEENCKVIIKGKTNFVIKTTSQNFIFLYKKNECPNYTIVLPKNSIPKNALTEKLISIFDKDPKLTNVYVPNNPDLIGFILFSMGISL